MLRVVENLEPLTVPELKLLEAVQSGGRCDFAGDGEADRAGGDNTDWGGDRRVRAAVLKAILSGDGEACGIGAGAAVNLRGAVVSGDLTGFDGSQLSAPSWAERALLYGYWAVSGYGLRASRALITLARSACWGSTALHPSRLRYPDPTNTTDRNDRPDQRSRHLYVASSGGGTRVLVRTRILCQREHFAATSPQHARHFYDGRWHSS